GSPPRARSPLSQVERILAQQQTTRAGPQRVDAGPERGRRGAEQAGDDAAAAEHGDAGLDAASPRAEDLVGRARPPPPARGPRSRGQEARNVAEAFRSTEPVPRQSAREDRSLAEERAGLVPDRQAAIEQVESPGLAPRGPSDRPRVEIEQ